MQDTLEESPKDRASVPCSQRALSVEWFVPSTKRRAFIIAYFSRNIHKLPRYHYLRLLVF